MEDKNDIKITPSVNILLPICVESETDVFFNILRNVIARSKLDEHILDNAVKLGMMGDKFYIKSKDLTKKWSDLVTMSQQIRQSKLIGFWAIDNFPSLGKKLNGKLWKASKEKCLQFSGNSKTVTAAEIDSIIFQKLKIRVIQLNVSESTLSKLKLFVHVPAIVGRKNESQISPKIKVFDIDDNWVEKCWEALKLGYFSLDVSVSVQVGQEFTVNACMLTFFLK